MGKHKLFYLLVAACIFVQNAGNIFAAEIHVAVSANFTFVIRKITKNFEAETGHKVRLISGSTGKHFAQIKNGAPFDAFFAADVKRPKLLDDEGIAQKGSRFTYAFGKLILWSPSKSYIDVDGKVLKQGNFRHLALANPKLAPYGKAAQEVLQALELWDELSRSAVRGENIGQTFQFVKTGNAELGFVAFSQIKRPGQPLVGSFWEVPEVLYAPIEQQAVLLKNNEIARAFLSFIKSKKSRKIIRRFGYKTK